MFENLSARLSDAAAALRGRGRLSEDNVKATLRQIRVALLEADVALAVVKEFLDQIRSAALGAEVAKSLTPGQALIGIVHRELIRLMGEDSHGLELRVQPPAVILLAGLQGAGKTTIAAKLARWLAERERCNPLLVSTDVYRPAALLQLERLAAEIGTAFHTAERGADPVAIATDALTAARRQGRDVLLVDTAGRLHVDQPMMEEIRRLHTALAPAETLFVVDSMAGQDAVHAARVFAAALPLTGVVLTKVDGDARGGAALSVRRITGAPIKFLGVGEKTSAIEPFHPDRVASRLLGMGDVVSLVEEVEQRVDRERAAKLTRKLRTGREFDLADLREQLMQMRQMGGFAALLDKLPAGGLPPGAAAALGDDSLIRHQIAIIDSMTPRERRQPRIIDGSRRRRIAGGSGTRVQDVNRLLKQHAQMGKLMKKMARGSLAGMLRSLPSGRPGA